VHLGLERVAPAVGVEVLEERILLDLSSSSAAFSRSASRRVRLVLPAPITPSITM
jgi:hypothetical protein